MKAEAAIAPDAGGFSLTNCGPVDRALVRLGLPGTDARHLLVRAFVPALVIWVPLLILALARPRDGAAAEIGFVSDLTTHVRFLLVVPLLILAEAAIGRRTRIVVRQFVDAELLTQPDRPRFVALLRQAGRALQSSLAEIVVAILAIVFVASAVRALSADGVTFWFEQPVTDGHARLTAAGWWYAVGSWLPPFLFLRWAWRYLVWSWLLLRVSKLDLQVVATHPDRAAGLGFVSLGHTTFGMVGFAMSCLVAAAIGTRVLYEGMSLESFRLPIAVFVGLAIIIGIAPLAAFSRPLKIAEESGLLVYGSFASRYAQGFHRKWVDANSTGHPLEAKEDIGPLADIGASYERVAETRILPVTLTTALAFAFAALAPMLPLLLTVMPLKDVLKLLMQAMI